MVALLPVLTACAYAPGMRIDQKYEDALGDAAAAAAAGLKTITPELLQAERLKREQQPLQDISKLVAKPTPYLIGNGDILTIVVWEHPELSLAAMSGTTTIIADGGAAAGFVLDHEGLLQFPYVGQIKLGGLTSEQARKLLTEKLSVFLKKPNLTLRVQAFRSQRIYIDGEVKLPGIQPINDVPMTLLEALNRAGGFLLTGDQSSINISRQGVTYPVDLPRLVRKGRNPADILLTDGDAVRVVSREESKVFVLGEVNRPLALPMRNGRLTLNEALGEAGGVNPTSADPRQIYVVRSAVDNKPIVYHLDAQSPVALALAEGFELNAKDVVYVDPVPLVRWNRVISLILPSAQAALSDAARLR